MFDVDLVYNYFKDKQSSEESKMNEKLLNSILKEESENYEDGKYFMLLEDENNNWTWISQERLKQLFQKIYTAGFDDGFNDGYVDGLQDGRREECKDWTELFDLVKLRQQLK